MSSHKKHQHLERIKDAVQKSPQLDQSKKSDTIKLLEEWVEEDKAEGLLYQELIKLTAEMKDILAELGLK
ncbi:MAG: hypothetical protein Q9M34_07035 [Sulfurimonas sp.]|nr:hypothetical protein [Sulfurimonas sp.]